VRSQGGDLPAASARVPYGQLAHEAAKDFWRRVVPELIELGLVTAIDVPAVLLMCEHYAIAMEAARVVARDGVSREDEHGVARKHPMLQILRDNSKVFRLYAEQFGMTTAARQRLEFEAPEEGDELVQLFFKYALDGDAR